MKHNFLKYILILFSQILFYILITLDINLTRDKSKVKAVINTGFISGLILFNMYFAVDAIKNNDYFLVFCYIVGAIFGKIIGMSLRK